MCQSLRGLTVVTTLSLVDILGTTIVLMSTLFILTRDGVGHQ